MENEKKLNEIPDSDLASVSGGVNWATCNDDIVGRPISVRRSENSGWREARITACYGDTYQVEFLDGKDPKTAIINCFGEIIG